MRRALTTFAVLTCFAASAALAQNAASLPNPIQGVGPFAIGGVNDCAGGELYDDGSAENGYSGNPALISSFQGVQQFTPGSYPWAYNNVCIALVSLGGPTLDFNVQVWDDDGTGGGPGTLLGSLPASVAGIPGGLPCAWYSFDISSLGINVSSGSVWIGVQWNPMSFPSRFVCADETAGTPLHPGFVNFNNPSTWQTIQSVFPAYRALLVRAEGGNPYVAPNILEIPTLGTVGLAILLVLLAASAFVALRRRRA